MFDEGPPLVVCSDTQHRFCMGTLPQCTPGDLRLIFFSRNVSESVDFIDKPVLFFLF